LRVLFHLLESLIALYNELIPLMLQLFNPQMEGDVLLLKLIVLVFAYHPRAANMIRRPIPNIIRFGAVTVRLSKSVRGVLNSTIRVASARFNTLLVFT